MTFDELIQKRSGKLFRLDGFDADHAVVLPTSQLAGEFVDDLDDILSDMGVEAFDGEDWVNESYTIIAVCGVGENKWIVQPQAFFIHSVDTDHVHVLEMAPADVDDFSALPVFADSLEEFDSKIL